MALAHAWNELSLPPILVELSAGRRFGFDVASVVKAIVFGRARKPGSERALVTGWLSTVHASESVETELQHAHDTPTFLAEICPELEAQLARVLADQLFVDATLVLLDTTSTHFEGLGHESLASFGDSRDKRGDQRQANSGLLTTREGYPLAHLLFPGRQSDLRSMAMASREFRERLALASIIVVADRTIVSEANLKALREEGISYIIAERLQRKTAHDVLARTGRHKRVTSTIEVKQATRDGAERVIVCRNQERAQEDAATRQSILASLEQQLETGAWRASLKPTARRYLKVDRADAHVDRKCIDTDARYDGKWILRTTTDLPAGQVALAARRLWRVETAFRPLKTPLDPRPIPHASEPGVRGHFQSRVLAYLLTCVLHDRLANTDRDLGVKYVLDQLARIQRAASGADGRQLLKPTRPNKQQCAIIDAIGAPIPPQHEAAW